jgi:hypothetical protein
MDTSVWTLNSILAEFMRAKLPLFTDYSDEVTYEFHPDREKVFVPEITYGVDESGWETLPEFLSLN